ncbi:hypothetical protein [Vibrio sp. FF145]|uniref:hypothetical protein n=1 Tax=Vibrio sp. FF145 TaxID=3230013 RepID=UPI00352F76C5
MIVCASDFVNPFEAKEKALSIEEVGKLKRYWYREAAALKHGYDDSYQDILNKISQLEELSPEFVSNFILSTDMFNSL